MEVGAFKKRVLISASVKSLCYFLFFIGLAFLSRVAFRHAFSLLVLARYLVIFLKFNTKERKIG